MAITWYDSHIIGTKIFKRGDVIYVKGNGYNSTYAGSSVGINYGDYYETKFYGYLTHDSVTLGYPISVGNVNGEAYPNYFITEDQIVGGGTSLYTVGTASVSAYDNRNGSYPNTGGWFESAVIRWSGFAGPSGNPIVNYHIYYRECPDGGNTPNGNWSGWIGVTGDAGTGGSFTVGSVNQGSSSSTWGNRNAWYQFVVIGIMQDGSNTGWSCTTNLLRKCTTSAYTFNANGGSGAPSTQYKFPGYDFVFPSTTPTRSGHTFKGWSTSSSATIAIIMLLNNYKQM